MWCPCSIQYAVRFGIKHFCLEICPASRPEMWYAKKDATIFGPKVVMALNLGHVGGVQREVALA
jgi:hypothetical protein